MACMGTGKVHAKVLVTKPERKKPLGRPRRRSEDNIKMDLQDRMGERSLDSSVSGLGLLRMR